MLKSTAAFSKWMLACLSFLVGRNASVLRAGDTQELGECRRQRARGELAQEHWRPVRSGRALLLPRAPRELQLDVAALPADWEARLDGRQALVVP